jgi:hypothetical protein
MSEEAKPESAWWAAGQSWEAEVWLLRGRHVLWSVEVPDQTVRVTAQLGEYAENCRIRHCDEQHALCHLSTELSQTEGSG